MIVRNVVVGRVWDCMSPQGRTASLFCIGIRSWSIEGWIHSNRRNRIGQNLVECLVRTHTNLKLEQRLEMYEAGLLPWDIEMMVEEPVSDDDDGPPHRVSDSESESESEQDSD